jgi:uncharacterized membrane-anchored protein YitT (DUF2179 family)
MRHEPKNKEIESQVIWLHSRIAILDEKIKKLMSPHPQAIFVFGICMIIASVFLSFSYSDEIASFTLFAIGLAASVYGYITIKDNKAEVINHKNEIKQLSEKLENLKSNY